MEDRRFGRFGLSRWLKRIGKLLQGEPRNQDEIIELLRRAQARQLLDGDALAMIEGVFEVSDMRVRDIMIPRAQMKVIDRDDDFDAIIEFVLSSGHSRYPVVGDSRDEIIGVMLAKDLLRFCHDLEDDAFDFNFMDLIRPASFVPESKRLNVLLKDFRRTRNHMAIVANEYGGVAGLVTIEDVLEQIVGDIDDEHDDEGGSNYILRHEDGLYTIKALTPIEDFNEYFDTHYSDKEFDTIGGLITNHVGRVPKRGERIDIDQFHFRVLRADTRRLHLLELTVDPPSVLSRD